MIRPESQPEEVPKWAHTFLWDCRQMLFTPQFNAVVCRLAELLPEAFPGAWLAATSLILRYDFDAVQRTTEYAGQTVAVRVSIPARIEVELAPGLPTAFSFGVMAGASESSRRILAELAAQRPSHELLFAEDFDPDGTFHVNTWASEPERPGRHV